MSKKKKIILWTIGLLAVGIGGYFLFKPMTVEEAVAIIKLKAPSASYQPGIMSNDFLVLWAKALKNENEQFLYNSIIYNSKDGHAYRP